MSKTIKRENEKGILFHGFVLINLTSLHLGLIRHRRDYHVRLEMKNIIEEMHIEGEFQRFT